MVDLYPEISSKYAATAATRDKEVICKKIYKRRGRYIGTVVALGNIVYIFSRATRLLRVAFFGARALFCLRFESSDGFLSMAMGFNVSIFFSGHQFYWRYVGGDPLRRYIRRRHWRLETDC